MQEFYRNIKCDWCGDESGNSDIMIEYRVIRLNNLVFDLCPKCAALYRSKLAEYQQALIEGFVNPEGRSSE